MPRALRTLAEISCVVSLEAAAYAVFSRAHNAGVRARACGRERAGTGGRAGERGRAGGRGRAGERRRAGLAAWDVRAPTGLPP